MLARLSVAFTLLSACGAPAAPARTAPPERSIEVAAAPAEPAPVERAPGEPARLESALAPLAPDAVAPADAARVRTFVRSRLGGEVTVIGGVPGDDPGVLVTARLPPPPDAAEGEELDDCERTRLVRVVTDSAGGQRVEGDLRGVCPSASGEGAQQGDVDGDGRLELVFVSSIVSYTMEDSRSGPGVPAGTVRRAVITDTLLRPQAELVLSERYEDTEGGEPEPSAVTRASLLDEDGDGLRDLLIETRRFSFYCEADDPWSVPEDDETCYPEDEREVRRYDLSADAWRAD